MWNQLKKWIASEVAVHPARGRARMSRFRGQFERLETRTVLSASMGPLPADYEANVVVVQIVWEGAYVDSALQSRLEANEGGLARWEDAPAATRNGYFADDRPYNAPAWPLAGIFMRPPYGIVFGTLHFEGQQSSTTSESEYKPPQLAKSANPAESSEAIAGTSPFGQMSNNMSLNGPAAQPLSRGAGGAFASFFLTLSDTPTAAVASATPSLDAHDAVFGDYSQQSLLLTTGLDFNDDDIDKDDLKNVDNELTNSNEEPTEILVNDDHLRSLDALERERDAIDSVLSQLHEVKLGTDKPTEDTSQTRERQNRESEYCAEDLQFSTNSYDTAAVANSDSEGGMVLLETSGDANSSVYDLSAVILSGTTIDHDVPYGVEIAVGLYQAFDVGTNELRPAAANDTPIAQPAAAIRPSVSAENAPAKKSEQPS